jgi:hypothetical protein
MKYRQTYDHFVPAHLMASPYRESGFQVKAGREPVQGRSVSYTIMAHPKRKEWAEELSEKLSCEITWDEKNDRHDTGFRSILAYNPDATHHCVIQDDSVVHDTFTSIVDEMIKYVPDNAPVGLYYGGKGSSNSAHVRAHKEAEANGACFLVRKGPIWGPGIIYPVSTIPFLKQFYKNSAVENYDRRVMRFYQKIGQDCWYTVPSLVQHRVENNPSLCGHDRGLRQARLFVGPQDGLEVDWSGPIVKAP